MTSASGPVDDVTRARRVDQVCTRFETAWRQGVPPRIEDFLDELPEPDPAELLRELALLDVYYWCRRGEAPHLGDYLRRFPALGPDWLAEAEQVAAEADS